MALRLLSRKQNLRKYCYTASNRYMISSTVIKAVEEIK